MHHAGALRKTDQVMLISAEVLGHLAHRVHSYSIDYEVFLAVRLWLRLTFGVSISLRTLSFSSFMFVAFARAEPYHALVRNGH